jgi:hypothetical protein
MKIQDKNQDLLSSSSFIVPNSNNSMYKTPSHSVQRLSSTSSQNPRGVDSLSMRMLNTNLNEVQGSESKKINFNSNLFYNLNGKQQQKIKEHHHLCSI